MKINHFHIYFISANFTKEMDQKGILHFLGGNGRFLPRSGKFLGVLAAIGILGGFFVAQALFIPNMTVSNPKTGDSVKDDIEIKWETACAGGDKVNITLIKDNAPYEPIASYIDCSPSTYSWHTKDTNGLSLYDDGADYKVMVYNIFSQATYTTGTFTIDNTAPSVAVPSLESALIGGFQKSITWNKDLVTDNLGLAEKPISFAYTTDPGENPTWVAIPLSAENDGSNDGAYEWALPQSVLYDSVRVKMTVIDKAGNTNSAISDYFVLDTIAPAVTVKSLNGGEKIAGGSTPTLNWEVVGSDAMPASTVVKYANDGITWETITVGEDNKWTVPSDNTSTAKIKVSISDLAGNVGSDESDAAFMIDSTAPESSFVAPSDYFGPVTYSGSFSGTASDTDGSGVAAVRIVIARNDGKFWNGTDWVTDTVNLTATGKESWSYTLPKEKLTDGSTYTITPTAIDNVGNSKAGIADSITYDAVIPAVRTDDGASSSWTNSDTIKFAINYGVSSRSKTKYVFIDNKICDSTVNFDDAGAIDYSSNTEIIVNEENKSGKYICLMAEDGAGNIAYQKTNPLEIDTTPAVITVSDDAAGSFQASDTVKFDVNYSTSGVGTTQYVLTNTDTCDASVNFTNATVYKSGSELIFDTEESNGKYVCLRARDIKGEQGAGEAFTYKASGKMQIDKTNPVVTIDPLTPIIKEFSLTVTGTYTETNINTILVNGVVATINTSNNTYTVDILLNNEGTNTIHAVITDLAGNTGNVSADLVRDTASPTMDTISPLDNSFLRGNAVLVFDFNDANLAYLELDIYRPEDTQSTKWQATLPANNSQLQALSSQFANYGVTEASYNEQEQKWIIILATQSAVWKEGSTRFFIEVGDAVGNTWGNMDGLAQLRTYIIDNVAPAFQTTDGVSTDPIKSDAINIVVTDVNNPITSSKYGFSNDDICNNSDNYETDFISGTDFIIAGDHADYLCVMASDAAGNTGYELVGKLNTDNTPPEVTVTSLVTNDRTPQLSGTVNDPAATVSIIVDGEIYAATVTPSGAAFTWTASVTDSLGDETYNVIATATDPATNAGTDSSSDELVVDGTAPSTSDNISNVWTNGNVDVTFTCGDGTGVGCKKVYYTTNGSNPDTSSSFVDAAGGWKFTLSTEGVYVVKYRGEDNLGNLEEAKNAELQVRIDKTAPVTTATVPTTVVNQDVTITLSASDTNGSGVSKTYYCKGATESCTDFAEYVSGFTVSDEGKTFIRFYSTDIAGNSEAGTNGAGIRSAEVNIDKTGPAMEITAPEANAEVNGAAIISFIKGDAVETDCSFDNSSWQACASGAALSSLTAFANLPEGNFTLYVRGKDAVGNYENKSVTLTKDTIAPDDYTVNIDQNYINALNKTKMSFTFSGAEIGTDYRYTVTDGTITLPAATGKIASENQKIEDIDVSGLADGTLTLSVILTDAAGNVGSGEEDTAAKDTIAPIVAEKTPVATPGKVKAPTYVYTSTEAGNAVYTGSFFQSDSGIAANGDNPITFKTLDDGFYSGGTIRVTDAAGNLSNILAVSSFVIDTTAPVISSQTPTVGVSTLDPIIKANFSDLSTVDDDGIQVMVTGGTIEFDNSYFSITPTGITSNTSGILLTKGTTYKVKIIGLKDILGNVTADYSWSFTVKNDAVSSDITAPTATTDPADNATGVALDIKPRIVFSELMDLETLNETTVQVRIYDSAVKVSGNLQYSEEDGKTVVTLNMPTTLDYGREYYFYIEGAKDMNGNAIVPWTYATRSSHNFTAKALHTPVAEKNISLQKGWNLISLPLIPTDSRIYLVLFHYGGLTSTDVGSVKYYNADNNQWQTYIPGTSGGTLESMEDGKGYWIYMNKPATLKIQGSESPAPGTTPSTYKVFGKEWNLIGYKSTVSMKAGEYITQMGSNDVLWAYKDGEYKLVTKDGVMESGLGYWFYTYDADGFDIIPTK